jgi:hypothetical protein
MSNPFFLAVRFSQGKALQYSLSLSPTGSLGGHTTIYCHRVPSDERGGLGTQPHHGFSNLLWPRKSSDWLGRNHLLQQLRTMAGNARDKRGIGSAGTDCTHAYPSLGVLQIGDDFDKYLFCLWLIQIYFFHFQRRLPFLEYRRFHTDSFLQLSGEYNYL